MKKLVCELCGSDDIVKQEGCFVCQQCGTKYSLEEAKRMMMEGGDAAPGITVKVDNSSFVERYLQNARRAKAKEDWEETEKYYNMVEQNEPTNIEAVFYSAYGKARTSLIDKDYYKREATFKVLNNSISVIDDNFDVEKKNRRNCWNKLRRILQDCLRQRLFIIQRKTNMARLHGLTAVLPWGCL